MEFCRRIRGLVASAADAAEYFKDQRDREVEKLFWSQFHAPVRPLLLNEQLAELLINRASD